VITIADDDDSVRASTAALLRSAGYKVQTFASADDLLNSGALGKTECLILDVRMPGTDGLELQRRLRAEDYRIPIIFITGYDDDLLRRRAIEAGAVDMFHKPFDANTFLITVETAIRGSSSRHLSNNRLREVAATPIVQTGYLKVNSVLTPDEADHFRECEQCINALANVVREMILGREKKKRAGNESQ
jgi:FixJ family two-component response regulator